MLTIEVKTIPHDKQAYPTVGNWVGNEKVRFVSVSEMGDHNMELLVAIHEVIEHALCLKRGITDEEVTAFDKAYQGDGEPGDDPLAPYHREHVYSTAVEMSLCKELGIDPIAYEKKLDEIYNKKKEKLQ